MKNLNKRLRREAEQNVPDLYNKIVEDAQSKGLFAQPAQKEDVKIAATAGAASSGGTHHANAGASKKFVYAAMAVVLAAALLLGILLPIFLKKGTAPGGRGTFSSPMTLTVDDFYGVGSISAAKLLGGTQAVARLGSRPSINGNDRNDTENKKRAEYFNRYFAALDGFMGDYSTKVEDNTDADFSGYDVKMTVNFGDVLGASETYIIYYNKTLSAEDPDDDERDSDEETSKLYILDGIIAADGQNVALYGEHSEESDDDEREVTLMLRVGDAASGNYAEFEQETSEESGEREIEYVYRVYQNNTVVEETAVEFETETKNKRTETEFELEFRIGSEKGKYKTTHTSKSGEISVEYRTSDGNGKFTVLAVNDGGTRRYEYAFPDGSNFVFTTP